MMEPLPERKEDEFWAEMDEVFHLDETGGTGETAKRSAGVIMAQRDTADRFMKLLSGITDELKKAGIKKCSVFKKNDASLKI